MKNIIYATRYHDISCGHRVAGHENKCAKIHGHNYRIHFYVRGVQDELGRVLDFSVIKSRLCMWLEDHWDHRFLIWEHDPKIGELRGGFEDDLVVLPFNPTAENMAQYLCQEVAPQQLSGTGCVLWKVKIEETRKCHAIYEINP